MLPAATSAMASLRGAALSVGFALPYSRLRLANPLAPSGRPTLPANCADSPSPAPYIPVFSSTDPPDRASLSWKFITPAMASEPYCAAAPSRSTSTWLSAMAGITEMSGPWEPYATPFPPCHSSTEERCRRLPLTSTSTWSGARLRSMAGRTTVEAPWMGCVFVLNDGTIARSCSFRSPVPCRRRSVAVRTSTGTADAVTLRASAREPTTTVSSRNPASRVCISAGRQSQGLDLGRRHTECAAQFLGERVRLSLHLFLRRLVPDFRARIGSEQGPRRRGHGQQQRNAPPRTSRSSFPSGSDHRFVLSDLR